MAVKFYSHKVQAFIGAMNYKRFICTCIAQILAGALFLGWNQDL